MYISLGQLRSSLDVLDSVHPFFGTSFLAFKSNDLPIEKPVSVDVVSLENLLLDRFYNPVPESHYYYMPLRAMGRKNRWVLKHKYSVSNLQKLRTATFKDAFVHKKLTDLWAWSTRYVDRLEAQLGPSKLSAFDLAVWLFRDQDWPNATNHNDIANHFYEFFRITKEEQLSLFVPPDIGQQRFDHSPLLQPEPITWKDLSQFVTAPPDAGPSEGGALDFISLHGVGPARDISLDLGERLNVLTGDNGLGKTFMLECIWWALSAQWADPSQYAYPRRDALRPEINFRISGNTEDKSESKTVYFDLKSQSWPSSNDKRPVLPGITIYSRVDGSATIWDPAKNYWSVNSQDVNNPESSSALRFAENDIWDGLKRNTSSGKQQYICNGLIGDWVAWQYREPQSPFPLLTRVLDKLSPYPGDVQLVPGTPTKLPRDSRELPTLRLPYGDVPVVLLSAGMKRILTLAYLLVWAWDTHKTDSDFIGRPPQSKIVLIIDEVEAHLHPRWQRIIIPALLSVIKELAVFLEVQLVVATHSPLVLASVEPFFDPLQDRLFTFDLISDELMVNEIPYSKQGSVDAWLTSDVFELKRPYSVEAETALVRAKNLQLSDSPDRIEVQRVSEDLVRYLPAIDPFWPRWRLFADKLGVKI